MSLLCAKQEAIDRLQRYGQHGGARGSFVGGRLHGGGSGAFLASRCRQIARAISQYAQPRQQQTGLSQPRRHADIGGARSLEYEEDVDVVARHDPVGYPGQLVHRHGKCPLVRMQGGGEVVRKQRCRDGRSAWDVDTRDAAGDLRDVVVAVRRARMKGSEAQCVRGNGGACTKRALRYDDATVVGGAVDRLRSNGGARRVHLRGLGWVPSLQQRDEREYYGDTHQEQRGEAGDLLR